jgi:hypothetical protein
VGVEHGWMTPAQAHKDVAVGLDDVRHATRLQVIAIREQNVPAVNRSPFQKLAAMGVGQLEPIAMKPHQVQGEVDPPPGSSSCRPLHRRTVDYPQPEALGDMNVLSQRAAQLSPEPSEPRRRCPQTLEQGHLGHVGDAAGTRLDDGLPEPPIVDGVKQK